MMVIILILLYPMTMQKIETLKQDKVVVVEKAERKNHLKRKKHLMLHLLFN